MLVQNFDMKTVPLSETMESGRPCNRKIESTKARAISSAFQVSCAGIKWADLEKWSTTTMMESYPSERGSFTIKSTPIVVQGRSGIGSGISFPCGGLQSTLTC